MRFSLKLGGIPSRHLTRALGLCVVLVAGGLYWRAILTAAAKAAPTLHNPFIELLKLTAAFAIGLVVTSVHKHTRGEREWSTSMEHAQILLCVSGALMMIIIGDSLARAFGIAGAASIIRFRTPVDDPKDAIILFLSLGFGMACGLGAFALAGLGMVFLCVAMVYLARQPERQPRRMVLAVAAAGEELPISQIQEVLDRNGVTFEQREVAHGPEAVVKYRVVVQPGLSLEDLSDELRRTTPEGIKSVVWERARKKNE